MGDNTAPGRSLDSRHFGAISRESIIGKVRTIYWPFARMGAVE
ncbi:MAG: S26 family signal peptidase [Verrucomicrobia bacterium]|nr:S26 family signal peptidase [Verrucomicrobiota bacterium]